MCLVQLVWHSVVVSQGGDSGGGGGASAASSAATHASGDSSLSRQSSTSGLPTGAGSPEPLLGSWAGRQTSFPAAAKHLPVKARSWTQLPLLHSHPSGHHDARQLAFVPSVKLYLCMSMPAWCLKGDRAARSAAESMARS